VKVKKGLPSGKGEREKKVEYREFKGFPDCGSPPLKMADQTQD